MTDLNREFLLAMRDGLLKQVDAIERALCIEPRTAELRKANKERHFIDEQHEQTRKDLHGINTD